jgi:hypothetical protein
MRHAHTHTHTQVYCHFLLVVLPSIHTHTHACTQTYTHKHTQPHTQVFCDFLLVVPPSVHVEVFGDKLDIIAEEQALASLTVAGSKPGTNSLSLNMGLVKVAIQGALKVWGGSGRVLLEDISAGTLDVSVVSGSVDVSTSQTPAQVDVVSESQSVCLVGAGLSEVAEKGIVDAAGNVTAHSYAARYACAPGPVCPKYSITSRGAGSVGLHVYGPDPKVYSGVCVYIYICM